MAKTKEQKRKEAQARNRATGVMKRTLEIQSWLFPEGTKYKKDGERHGYQNPFVEGALGPRFQKELEKLDNDYYAAHEVLRKEIISYLDYLKENESDADGNNVWTSGKWHVPTWLLRASGQIFLVGSMW